jgi:hypothetical protein
LLLRLKEKVMDKSMLGIYPSSCKSQFLEPRFTIFEPRSPAMRLKNSFPRPQNLTFSLPKTNPQHALRKVFKNLVFIMNSRIRFLLIFFFLILGIILHVKLGFSSAWYLYISSFILLMTHFLFGNIWAAFSKLRKGKIQEAENLINQIKRPDFLAKKPRAYYHFIKGMIALQREELKEGETQLVQALERGLRTPNDNALTALNIAHIYFKQNKLQDCRTYLKKSKAFNSNDLMIKQKIDELERVLATPYN